MSEKSEVSAAIIGGGVVAIGVVGFAAVLTIWGGFVLQQLWNWYGAPLTNVRLGLAQAIGIQALLSWVKGYRTKTSDTRGGDLLNVLVWSVLLLLIGWAAHQWGGA